MKIGLIGFGRTGKAVAEVVLRNPHFCLEWVVRHSQIGHNSNVPEYLGIDSSEPGTILCKQTLTADELLDRRPVDAIVDFSSVTGIDFYGEEAAKREITIISGVSQYDELVLDRFKKLSKGTRILWSPNITLGINFLMVAAKALRQIAPQANIHIIEEHFREKQDVSGTARRLAEELDVNSTEISSVRAGGIVGTHEVLFGFPFQTLRIRHESIARQAFGNGALFAASELMDRERGLYRMEDLLQPYFAQSLNRT